MIKDIPNPMRRLIRTQLGYFQEAMPDNFELQGASIGNLILTGGYLNNHKHLDPIIFLFSKLVGVLGTVRAVVNDNLHLEAELKDGTRILGQHLLTGKEVAPLTSPIERLYLAGKARQKSPVKSELRKKNRKLIERAELICYPPGSFYSSLIAQFPASRSRLGGRRKPQSETLYTQSRQGSRADRNDDGSIHSLPAQSSALRCRQQVSRCTAAELCHARQQAR